MSCRRVVPLLLFSILCGSLVFGQNPPPSGGQRMMMRFDAETSVLLREIMTMVSEENGTLKIMMVPPADRRPEGMPTVDLQRGDEVGMAAGKRIKTIKELRSAYESSKPGEEFKLGVRRDGRPLVVTFTRKAENDMPGGGMMAIRTGPGDEKTDVFPALGLVLEKKEAGVVVAETMPHASKEIRKGDVVTTLNGAAVTTVADFSKALDATKVGETLTFVLDRKGEQRTVAFPRPEPRGGMRIMRQ